LNSYMRVTNPPVWIILGLIIILLAGALIWGIYGRIETKAGGVVIVGSGRSVCCISESDIADIDPSMSVIIGDKSYPIEAISNTSVSAGSVLNTYAMELGGFSSGEYMYMLLISTDLNDGNYPCEIVTESVPAVYFLLNPAE